MEKIPAKISFEDGFGNLILTSTRKFKKMMATSHPQRIFQCMFPQNPWNFEKDFFGHQKNICDSKAGTAGIQSLDVHIVSFHHLQQVQRKKTRRNNNLDVPGS